MTDLNRSILRNMFKTPLLRNFLLVCLAVSILFPIYGIFYEIPSLTRVVQKTSENEALTVTKHLTKTIFPDRYILKKEFFSNDVIAKTKVIIEDFQLEKIKIFSESGEIVYSSDSQDIGKLNKKEYFHEIVAKGSIYSKVVKKEDKTLEGRIVNADVVEIYVPLIDKGKFQGAFEIYYDITDKREMLNKQWHHSLYFLSALALIVFISIILLLLRASKLNLDSKENESTLREGEEKYRTLIENAGEAIIVAQDGIFKFANPKGEELYGFSKEELASRPLTDFIHEEDREMVGERHKRRLRGEELPKTYPFRIINKVGDTKWVQLSAVPFSWDNKPAVLCYMTDITERKRVEEALRESEDKYRSIIESIEEGYYEIDDKGKFVFINESLERIFGRPESELIGRFIGGFTDEANRKIGIKAFTEVYKTGNPLRGFEWEISQKDGGKRYVSASVSLMTDPQGNKKGLRGIIRDVTRRKKDEEKLKAYAEQLKTANIELDEAKQAAENATKAKSEFLANMSHELRTPLNAIIGFSEQMTEADFDLEKSGEYAKIIENSGRHQLRVVNEILDISKIEAGKLKLEKIPFNLDALLKDVQSTGSMILESRNKSDVFFNVNYHDSISDYIIGDPTKFRQVLLNFLGNATRFTKKGSINIDVRLKDEKALECCVEDTGTGIPKDKLETIFEPFQQVDPSTTRKYGGTGLGLDLNRKLINLWGGEIWVDSILGKGSKFSFTMPYIPAEKPQDKKKSLESYKIDPKKDYKILIAEDNPVNLRLAMMYLKSYGLRNIITASHGVEAVSAFKEHKPDLVLMDVHMPVLDGLSATKEIREYEKNSGITRASIIALTASAMEGDREKCLDAGCNDYTTKPIIKVELEKKIAQNLK